MGFLNINYAHERRMFLPKFPHFSRKRVFGALSYEKFYAFYKIVNNIFSTIRRQGWVIHNSADLSTKKRAKTRRRMTQSRRELAAPWNLLRKWSCLRQWTAPTPQKISMIFRGTPMVHELRQWRVNCTCGALRMFFFDKTLSLRRASTP